MNQLISDSYIDNTLQSVIHKISCFFSECADTDGVCTCSCSCAIGPSMFLFICLFACVCVCVCVCQMLVLVCASGIM